MKGFATRTRLETEAKGSSEVGDLKQQANLLKQNKERYKSLITCGLNNFGGLVYEGNPHIK